MSLVEYTTESQNARWLAKLRWVAVAGQLVTVAVVIGILKVDVWLLPLAIAITGTAASNLSLSLWLRTQPVLSPRGWQAIVGLLTLLDLVVLTAMLLVTGGPTNPFCVFLYVNLALAGVALPALWAWLAYGVGIAPWVLMTWWHHSLTVLVLPERLWPLRDLPSTPVATLGSLVAFAACAGTIVLFLTRLTAALAASEAARRRAEALQARSEKLEALGTLAAGAAHELATPLSTIAVVTTELERLLEAKGIDGEPLDDVRLLRGELARCRAILDRMAADSGQLQGETPRRVSVANLVAGVLADITRRDQVTVALDAGSGEHELRVPVVLLEQSLRGIVRNALDAGGSAQVRATAAADRLQLTISDQGPGMQAEVRERAGEPFFTTKEPGRGMGLGLFLARSVVERLGGALVIDSRPGTGTVVLVELPLSASDNSQP